MAGISIAIAWDVGPAFLRRQPDCLGHDLLKDTYSFSCAHTIGTTRSLDEDRGHNRADSAPVKLVVLRKSPFNMLRHVRRNIFISLKRNRVGWSNQIAYNILGPMR
ncbi:hypothetical protein [Rhodovibrio sodomensis]|uniref:hypothetical protein n=1 Tax=Rhodovibrio sodomensis TaxID=1088 RepID=UPI0019038308|nr:hypothetical protein [Rhodovibrio sodomensis]